MNPRSRSEFSARPWRALGDEADRVFDGFSRPTEPAPPAATGPLVPPLDVAEHERTYRITVDLPGVRRDDIELTVHEGLLTISAEARAEEESPGRMIRRERGHGRYLRSLRLGAELDEQGMTARYADGVLRIEIPKAATLMPRKVTVQPR